MNICVSQLPVKSNWFTLKPAAENNREDYETFKLLHIALFTQLSNEEKNLDVKYPEYIKEFDIFCLVWDLNIFELIEAELIEKVNEKYKLTKKSIKIFEEAAEIKKQLDEDDFSFEEIYGIKKSS